MSPYGPPYPLIREALLESRVIPFLGAGASLGLMPAGELWEKGKHNLLPTAGDLARHLAQKTMFPEADMQLATVAQYFAVVGGRPLLEHELHEIFDCDYPVNAIHTFLAELPAELLVVTTN